MWVEATGIDKKPPGISKKTSGLGAFGTILRTLPLFSVVVKALQG